jgi:hypothetical protein
MTSRANSSVSPATAGYSIARMSQSMRRRA